MSLLQKTIAELRELQHEEIDLVGGGVPGPTGGPTYCPTVSLVPNGGQVYVSDDGSGDFSTDYNMS